MIKIAENIKKIRESKNLKQKELAQYLGIDTFQTVSNWETGRSAPELKYIIEIAKLGGVTTDWLIIGEDSTLIIKEENQTYNPNLEKRIEELESEIKKLKEKLVDYSDALLEKDKKIREYENKPSFRVQSSPNG